VFWEKKNRGIHNSPLGGEEKNDTERGKPGDSVVLQQLKKKKKKYGSRTNAMSHSTVPEGRSRGSAKNGKSPILGRKTDPVSQAMTEHC